MAEIVLAFHGCNPVLHIISIIKPWNFLSSFPFPLHTVERNSIGCRRPIVDRSRLQNASVLRKQSLITYVRAITHAPLRGFCELEALDLRGVLLAAAFQRLYPLFEIGEIGSRTLI